MSVRNRTGVIRLEVGDNNRLYHTHDIGHQIIQELQQVAYYF